MTFAKANESTARVINKVATLNIAVHVTKP